VEAANGAQTIWVSTACEEGHSQKNLSKLTLRYLNVCNQIDLGCLKKPIILFLRRELRRVFIDVLIR